MPDPEPPQLVFATFNDATLEVICHFDRRLLDGQVFITNCFGWINRGGGYWEFGSLAPPVVFNRNVTFTANIIGPDVPGPNLIGYNPNFAPFLVGWTGAAVAPYLSPNLTLI